MTDTPILHAIKKSSDIKRLSDRQLALLCGELRTEIIDTVMQTGGHLASNLGVVELTVALHSVLNLSRDKILWDVGHQCYAHKLLTGRQQAFSTLRQKDGLSGFPKPRESSYDHFVAGHASTSIAAAIGMRASMDMQGEQGEVVAVIGDGALTGGLAFEAINNLGMHGRKVIVVLNDNEMAISRNQGAVAGYLAAIRNRPGYFVAKRVTRESLDRIPVVGTPAKNLIARTKTIVKQIVYPMTFFEQFGFTYLGPVNGHDIVELKAVLRQARQLHEPVLVHVQTQKGRGYMPAERDPGAYHGVSPSRSGRVSFSDVFGRKLCELAEQDRRVCAITAAMSDGTGLCEFESRFGSQGRFFDVGIAEGFGATFASAMGAAGSVPVFAVYSTFLQRAYDQLIHDMAIEGEHVVLAVDRAGLVGEDGETHQGIFDAAFLSGIPGMVVHSPATFEQLEASLAWAVGEQEGPVAIRYPRGAEPTFPENYRPTTEAFTHVRRRGAKRLVVSYGRVGAEAAAAVQKMTGTSLLLLSQIAPLPQGALEEACDYDAIYFAEEGIETGGIGQQFAAGLMLRGYKGAYHLRAINGFVPQGRVDELLEDSGLTAGRLREWIMGR